MCYLSFGIMLSYKLSSASSRLKWSFIFSPIWILDFLMITTAIAHLSENKCAYKNEASKDFELGITNLSNGIFSSLFTIMLFLKLEEPSWIERPLPNLCIFIPLWSLLLFNIVLYSSKQYKQRGF
ncbi:Oidioi.mRNA.OKI2018_I69.chr2.g5886.t1.cds [Oikopleura dioica]|uniref:Oidioi.mRNA.OKI2018_I69.chr2.g5886.t1.cds n=1 Tax=Oikopleura dioica TaxID=34765 RepID=A0ABN7T3G8_OIKDI|nr:Oidioi.mRNA.OKI2018_I69.chr2.g5886.t1.cds [Oikopleura dioica]